MDPNLWGPSAWYFLHSITYNYPEKPSSVEKKAAINFFKSLKHLLPCSVCKINYDKHFENHKIENNLNSKRELVHWLIDIHNKVNQDTGKPTMTYESVLSSKPLQYASPMTNLKIAGILVVFLYMINKQ